METLEPQAARAQLDRILASEGFVKADRLCRFLRFTVEAKLNGSDDQIKEYLLGREVFDRNDDYDPRLDPIVRVEARRLRAKLDEYYAGPGIADPVRIEFPKGSYIPVMQPLVPASKPRRRVWWLAAATLVVLIAGVAIYRSTRVDASLPVTAVVPEQWLWAEKGGSEVIEAGLAELLTAELANTRAARVIAWPIVQHRRAPAKDTKDIAAIFGADRVLLVKANSTSGAALFLIDGKSGQKLWYSESVNSDLSTHEGQKEVARRVAADLKSFGSENKR